MKQIIVAATALLCATPALAQHAHSTGNIAETGQSQFAAIAEIVTVLRADANTDWASVNITALRDHLVDMDNVTSRSSVETSTDGLTVTFAVTGEPMVAQSIQRMVKAHASMLQAAVGWTARAQSDSDGAKLVLEAASIDEFQEIMGLGFYGVMTVGAHHQQHHLMIAKGRSPH